MNAAAFSDDEALRMDKAPWAEFWTDGDLVGVAWRSGEMLRSGNDYTIRVAKDRFRGFAKNVADFADELDRRDKANG